ncbi:MAG TPA: GAF domain-containing protein [Bacteroidales bacterium]|nr:GAF domain-containing protein [Bacteroidales bacterium]
MNIMLEFLDKKMLKRKKTAESMVPVIETRNQEEPVYEKEKQVENFIKNIRCNGKSLPQYSVKFLSQVAREKEVSQGAFFVTDEKDGRKYIKFLSGFASPEPDDTHNILEIGEGFPGQVAKDGKMMNISDIPEGYLTIESGLGKAAPVSLLIFPVKHKNDVIAVIELASFHKFTEEDESFFESISPFVAEQIIKCKGKA